ncbi:DUF4158 domain-containing protein [Nonomuraea sp. NPDC050680]|uniref:DUF4158 domain-containing protein n=1 Tax=Nonomuraea sp. NPDC050680 TaxID=3154630 RepID=UPI0033D88CE8
MAEGLPAAGLFPEAQRHPCSALRAHPRDDRPAGGGAGDAAERSAKRHRSFVRTRMGVTYDAARVREVADEAIRKAAQAKDNPADLINVALEELVRAECELPGYTTPDEMTKKIRTEVNRGFFALVSGRVDAGARARSARLLLVDPITRRSEYDGLKDVAQAASLNKFKGRLAFLHELDGLGPTEVWLEGVPPGKIAHFAGEARVTDIADLRKVLDEDKRLTLIVSTCAARSAPPSAAGSATGSSTSPRRLQIPPPASTSSPRSSSPHSRAASVGRSSGTVSMSQAPLHSRWGIVCNRAAFVVSA